MLLCHDCVLSAIHGLLSGAGDDGVLRPRADDHLLCGRSDHHLLCPNYDHDVLCSGADHYVLRSDYDHRVLCSGANHRLLRSENNLLFCGADDGLLSGEIYLSDLLHVLSTLVVAVILNRNCAALNT
jgi:hypothetical protein